MTFAERMGITKAQETRLKRYVNEAINAQELSCNSGYDANPACSKVDSYCRKLGLGTDWRVGMNPLITKGELSEHIVD